jgi:hypothetical protein
MNSPNYEQPIKIVSELSQQYKDSQPQYYPQDGRRSPQELRANQIKRPESLNRFMDPIAQNKYAPSKRRSSMENSP